MNRIKKFAAALTAFSVAATMASCSAPAIGSGSANAVKVDDYQVKAGVFIFYTLTSYFEAREIVGSDADAEEIEDAHIDNLEATEWIQNKATEYCSDFVAIEKEFDKIGAELTDEERETIDSAVEQYAGLDIYTENGIGEESVRTIITNEYKRQHVFDYYYGFDGEWGMSEDELKDYFDENFARVKYITLSYLDAEGNELDDSGKKEIREMAEDYADRVNSKSGDMEKLFEMNEVKEDYDEYVADQTAALSTDTVTTTTTTTTTTVSSETTTTTTTDPYANERVIQKQTTTTPSEENEAVTTTATTLSASQKSQQKLNAFVFSELDELNKAVVFNDEENDAIYVVIRADLRERMTEDDYWSEDYIQALQSQNFEEDFADYIEGISAAYAVERNKSAYKRYSPFKLDLDAGASQ